jgi:hypothetical protein
MSTERRIVILSVMMSVCFGPLGIVFGRVLGGSGQSLSRWIELTAWFFAYGLVMGLVLAYAWRVENPGRARRAPRRRDYGEYWIGDWSQVLGDADAAKDKGPTTARPPRP